MHLHAVLIVITVAPELVTHLVVQIHNVTAVVINVDHLHVQLALVQATVLLATGIVVEAITIMNNAMGVFGKVNLTMIAIVREIVANVIGTVIAVQMMSGVRVQH